MNSSPSFAANLSSDARKGLAILSLSKAEPIAHLADREGVSRQFLYRQKQKAAVASVLHGKGPGDRECIPIVVRFGSDAA
jgi:hypothetical protein